MLGIILTLAAMVLVICLAFCYSDHDSRANERLTELLDKRKGLHSIDD